MKLFRTLTLAAAGLVLTACTGASTGIELSGLWVATSHVYESGSGETVDIVARDGASTAITVNRTTNGWRVAVSMDDGLGDTSILYGSINDQRFTLGPTVWSFERNGEEMTVTDPDDTFDFGEGPEPAELTIRLMRL